ncbi:quinone oxidoreductase [Albimonas sp. CAU 1670]|uniref:quinone oxidoreductase family protein n=1 Tax=Albimonas sp. CAU 1670 TaxID=3032599 RepID=UPI0023DC7BE1|nr:quinone oxidoreductase [Albimonas sp. CAU 1670]MDF2235466.1 quinone oxidoreductase [Albimonas sp. CAU 1670]
MTRAIVLRRPGGPEALAMEDHDPGRPGPGELRARITAAGVNFHDVYVRSGLYSTLPLPGVPGIEAAGVVEAVGEGVEGISVGQRIAWVTRGYGGYAEAAVIPAGLALKLPDGVSDVQAASLTLKGLTARMLVKDVWTLEAGQTALVHAGAGGVGQILVAWSKALGAEVIATVGSPAKAEVARACGADHVVLYREEDFVARVAEITGGRGVDVAYDSVGKDTFEGSLDCLARLGRLVNFGQSSGPVAPLEVSRLFKGSNSLARPSVFAYLADPWRAEAMAADLFAAIEAGVAKTRVERELPLAEAAEAHRLLESRTLAGAVVLRP